MKIIMVMAIIAILFALGMAGQSMLRQRKPSDVPSRRMAKALAWRIGLSVTLFLFVLFAYAMGWISPKGI